MSDPPPKKSSAEASVLVISSPKNPKKYTSPRKANGTFAPGSSGSVGGWRNLRKLIAEYTGEGEELVVHALGVLRGTSTVTEIQWGKEVDIYPTFKDQSDARKWLADRLWGKAPETVKVEQTAGTAERVGDLDNLTDAEMVQYAMLTRKLSASRSHHLLGPSGDTDSAGDVDSECSGGDEEA